MHRYTYRLFSKALVVLVMLVFLCDVHAQKRKCGFDETVRSLKASNPYVEDVLAENYNNSRRLAKTSSAIDSPIIPIVFHIILTKNQIAFLGGEQIIADRIKAQVKVLNEDFNAQNADSVAIPGGFKQLYGNVRFRFALAQTAPDGSATEGYQIITTDKTGFDIEGGWGSGFGFSSAKYPQGGGVAAWDVNRYLNIWILNPLEFGGVTDVLGLAIPTYLTIGNTGIDPVEKGIVLHYRVFGDRKQVPGPYLGGSNNGRTLTHEVGHYFELLHIWGDDEGKCPDTRGQDDGISDTPPQSYPSYGCEIYPKYDGCTKTGDGIMYMNYMDYSDDSCLLLFTHEQAARMRLSVQFGGNAYSLTQQQHLLSKPGTNTSAINDFVIYPNPADNVLNIRFKKQAEGLQGIFITDISGRVVAREEYENQSGFYSFSTAGFYTGIYFVVFDFSSGKVVEKVLVR